MQNTKNIKKISKSETEKSKKDILKMSFFQKHIILLKKK